MAKLLRALDRPFLELESLEIYTIYDDSLDNRYYNRLALPSKIISTSASRLRRLALWDVVPECLTLPLSRATGLVDLSLILKIPPYYSGLPEASFLTNLKRMSCLRRLELKLAYSGYLRQEPGCPYPPVGGGDAFSLSKLTHLIFNGHGPYLEAILVGLAAPSLQRLEVDLIAARFSDSEPVPHLCRFISDAQCRFITVRLDFPGNYYRPRFKLYAETCLNQPFSLTIPGPISLEEMGNRLSGPLSTVEELVVGWDNLPWATPSFSHWHTFFNHIHQVKTVRVPSFVARDVADSFLQDGQVPSVGLLPALEQVEVHMMMAPSMLPNANDDLATIRDAFKPLITARRRVGQPITLLWT